jgi:hypothetical protein
MLPNGSMRAVKELTWSFLCDQLHTFGVHDPINFLQPYLRPTSAKTEKEFLRLLIDHSYNRSAGPIIVGRPIAARRAAFDDLVCQYEANEILSRWTTTPETLGKAFVDQGFTKQLGKYWHDFAKSILDSAGFVIEYKFNQLKQDVQASELAALGGIKFLESKIHGFGFALSADVLREAGLIDSIKPDTHIKKLAQIIRLHSQGDAALLIDINRLCKADGISPFVLDRLVWMAHAREPFFLHRREIECKINTAQWTSLMEERFAA